MLKPRFRFQDIKGVQSVNFALSRGVQPSLCVVQIPYDPNLQLSNEPSDLFISDGERSVTFSKCIVNDVSPSITEGGERITQIGILDRRWMWQYGQVSGEYNYPEVLLSMAQYLEWIANMRKQGNDFKVRAKSEALLSLRGLCDGLLRQMGEFEFDVSRVPDDVYPYCNWDLVVPAIALDDLCQANNLHVILNARDRVEIWPKGEGDKSGKVAGLPAYPSSSASFGVSNGAIPDRVCVTTAPMLFQYDFFLVPMGKTREGEFKFIDLLPYAPEVPGKGKTWERSDPRNFATVTSEIDRKLALDSVFKYYSIANPLSFVIDPKARGMGGGRNVTDVFGLPDTPESVMQFDLKEYQLILDTIAPTKEMHTEVVDGKTVIKERIIPPFIENVPSFAKKPPVRKDAIILGVFYNEKGSGGNNITDDAFKKIQKFDTDAMPELVYKNAFTIDNEKKMVVFSDAIYRFKNVEVEFKKDDGTTGKRIELITEHPYIKLRCAFAYRQHQNRAFYRFSKTQQVVDRLRGTPTQFVAREDVEPFQYKHPVTQEVIQNDDDVIPQLDYYLDVESKRLKMQEIANSTYPMLLPLNPDGIRAQVVWAIGTRGIQTTVSVGEELVTNMPKYDDRRKLLQFSRTIKTLQQTISKPLEKPKPTRVNE